MKKHILYELIGIISVGFILTGCGKDPLSSAIRAIEQGHFQKAEQILAQILQDDPDDVNARMNLYIVQLKNGQQESAFDGFLQVAQLAPNDSRPLEYAASIQIDNNHWSEAAALLSEALRRAPRSSSVQTALAIVDLNTSGADIARDRLLKIISDFPSYGPALFNLGVIHRDWLKNQNEAKKYFQRYLALEKNDSHVVIARVAMNEKMRTPVAPVAPATPRNAKLAAELFTEAVKYHQARETEKAIEAYTRAIRNDPAMIRAHYNLGLLLRDKRDLVQARAEFEQALSLAPGMSDARYMLALVMIDQGRDAEAVGQLKALIEKAPRHAEAHLALGLIYKKDPAKRDLARKEFNTYLKLDPNGTSARDIRNWLKYLQ